MIQKPLCCVACLLLAGPATAEAAEPYFAIHVVDEATQRGVPLVELETVNHIRHVTDSNGFVAFREPGLMDRDVFFHVRSHGYEFPQDGFGNSGRALRTKPGERAVLKIRRVNLAERLYRVTGAGIYRDSLLLNEPTPIREPALNAQVTGSDSVVNAVYRGKIHWFWGDTNKPSYPLGNFDVPGATSELPGGGAADPDRGIDLSYFTDETGFARPTAKMPGSGPTWIDGLAALKSDSGERMFAGYVKIKPPLAVYERGLCEWNDESKRFERRTGLPLDAPLVPAGHTFQHRTGETDHVYFGSPYPLVRVRATQDDFLDVSRYEAYTCLKSGSRLSAPVFDRDAAGRLRYSWKRDAPAVGAAEQKKLIRAGTLKPDEALLRLADREGGERILAHRGSVCWNEWRQRWVMIAVQQFGTSVLGEVWYAEADAPTGPWAYAVKIVTHDKYSFYNPKQHAMYDRDKGKTIYFEGTYTQTFSGNAEATPRYDYNQIMYRLDLSDPRLTLPTACFKNDDGVVRRLTSEEVRWDRIAFFGADRAGIETAPVFAERAARDGIRLRVGTPGAQEDATPLFHAIAPDRKPLPKTAIPLWEFRAADLKTFAYSPDRDWKRAGYTRQEAPVCYVWRTP